MVSPSRTLVVVTGALLALCISGSAQIPGPGGRVNVDLAEVRGLDAVPSDVASAFETATLGPNFEVTTRAVLVRFRAPTPPADNDLAVVWTVVPVGGQAQQLGRVAVDPARLSAGITEALSDTGTSFVRGKYQVSLVGRNNRHYRTLEFTIGVKPERVRRSRSTAPLDKAYFDQYSFVYPKNFTPQPVVAGMTGVLLIKRAPFTLMFAVLSKEGSDTVLPQGRRVVQAWLTRLGQIFRIGEVQTWDIPAEQLGPDMTFGKGVIAKLPRGMTAHANLYSQTVDGRKILVGYATLSGEGVRTDYQQFITVDNEAAADDFFDMAASLVGGTPWKDKTPGEAPRY
jgi:hypothetical protein